MAKEGAVTVDGYDAIKIKGGQHLGYCYHAPL